MMQNRTRRQQKGLTIVELMVGLTLSLLLVGGVLQVYLGTKTTYKVTEALSRLQENTRFSLDMLARDIRMAGYVPCSRPQTTSNIVNAGVNDWWAPLFANSIRGFENGANPFPDDSSNQVVPGSDSILILRGGNKVAGVNFFNSTTDEFIMQRDLGSGWVKDGSLMIACDSTNATLFQAGVIQSGSVTRVSVADGSGGESPGNSSALSYAFNTDAQLANYKAIAYYITNSSSGDGFSLYRRYLNVNNSKQNSPLTEELIEGVESMQLLYGLDNNDDGIADRYMQADNIGINSWSDVVTVRVGLLFASEDGLRDVEGIDNDTYLVANTSIGVTGNVTHSPDRRKRYVSSMTVSIRNI